MKIIILAGGGGTRLFPLSRTSYPKQFLKLGQEKSLLAQTVLRFMPLVAANDIIIVTNKEYLHHVKAELMECGAEKAHILLEPAARNTAPAIALAAKFCQDTLGCEDHEVLVVTPADHVIKPAEVFCHTVTEAASLAARDKIVTFGIKPTHPETGYGYIKAGEKYFNGYIVESFREKPDKATAEKYLAAGNYYWNSGMFIFQIAVLMEELAAYQGQIYALAAEGVQALLARFGEMPSVSIDYAVAEKSRRVVTMPLTAYWNDIGSWDAIYDVLPKDQNANAVQGDCLPVECKGSLILGRDRLIAGIGLEDVLVVETDDVIVVARRGESQKVKEVVDELKKQGRREAAEHTTVYRPWGNHTLLGEAAGYKMRKMLLNPGQRLNLHLHHHRSEHWIVIKGTAEVQIGDTIHMLHENQSVFVPQSTKHYMSNPGKIPLEIIEVQNGSYLAEDDIVRFEELYGKD